MFRWPDVQMFSDWNKVFSFVCLFAEAVAKFSFQFSFDSKQLNLPLFDGVFALLSFACKKISGQIKNVKSRWLREISVKLNMILSSQNVRTNGNVYIDCSRFRLIENLVIGATIVVVFFSSITFNDTIWYNNEYTWNAAHLSANNAHSTVQM